jgi:diguanylate cyclase (GGDEF)-like protein/PAS domain S-box-containing protein
MHRMGTNLGGRFNSLVTRAGGTRWRSTDRLPLLLLVLVLAATSVEAYRQHNAAISAWNKEVARTYQLVALANHDALARTSAELERTESALATAQPAIDSGAGPDVIAATVVETVGSSGPPGLLAVLALDGQTEVLLPVGDQPALATLDEADLTSRLTFALSSVDPASLTAADSDGFLAIARPLPGTDQPGGVALVLDSRRFPSTHDVALAGTLTTVTLSRRDNGQIWNGESGELAREAVAVVDGVSLVVRTELEDGLPGRPGPLGVAGSVLLGSLIAVVTAGLTRTVTSARAETAAAADRAVTAEQVASERFRRTFDGSPIGMAELDRAGIFVQVNPALGRQVGRDPTGMVGASVISIVHPEDQEPYARKLAAVIHGHQPAARSEHRYRHRDGSIVWVDESLTGIADENGVVGSLLLHAQDITARREAVSELAWQAFHDELTGLPNRALFLNRLRNALDRVARQPGIVAVMFVDIDRFKVVNDSLGHKAGDLLLNEISARLGTAVRVGDTVARFGGDEFVVLCENVSGASEALWIAQRIQQSLQAPLDSLRGLPGSGSATASIGITLSTSEDVACAEDLLRDADAAMYRAKELGRNRIEIFDPSLRHAAIARLEIESQLRDALDNGDMVLHYQAIVDTMTELPVGYEALIRWHHPDKGLLGPTAFLPVAEDAGVMHHIDSWTLRQTCLQIAEWNRRFPEFRDLYVSTNWSARQLGQFVQLVEQVVPETGISPSQLLIEVTEGFLLEDTDGTMEAIRRLKRLGVRVAIDDFGTGYSSLSYLTRLDVDYLKIDKSFVFKLPDPAASAVVGAIADMASRLGIGLIAEGVETDEQLHHLRRLGDVRLQGYRFSKPRWASEVTDALERRFRGAEALTLN